MFDSSLHYPDLPVWQNATGYSPIVAQVLTKAYQHLQHTPARLDHFAAIHQLVSRHLDQLMSDRQRMHALYLLGSSCMAVSESALALDYFGEAAEIACFSLQDAKASAELAYLHGTAHSWLLQYNAAADDLRDALGILRGLGEDATSRTAAFELTVLGDVAGFEFVLAQYELAMQHLDEAVPLLARGEYDRQGVGTIVWVWALIHRWRGQVEQALHHALVAAEHYATAEASASYGRIQSIVAEIALDQAEFFGSGHASGAFLAMANPYTHRAILQARMSQDPMGEALALLTQARLSRLMRQNEDRVATLERIIKTAEQVHDAAVLAPAFTELGHELAMQGEISSALQCYIEAMQRADSGEVPALGRWARRAVLRHQEL